MIVGKRGPAVVLEADVCTDFERMAVAWLARSIREHEQVRPATAAAVANIRTAAAQYRSDLLPQPATEEFRFEDVCDDLDYDDWLTTAEAARALGCGERNVRYLAERHRLGRRVRGRWRFDPVDVDMYRQGVVNGSTSDRGRGWSVAG